ncbi:MAG: DUF4339 domain-containing protein [Sulfuritalea sp.]|nr:DUF4339 domain-containing protein [Sulfuritalea sp.]
MREFYRQPAGCKRCHRFSRRSGYFIRACRSAFDGIPPAGESLPMSKVRIADIGQANYHLPLLRTWKLLIMSNWYYCKNGKQAGPVTLDELKSMVASGDLAETLSVWKVGTPAWIRIGKAPELVSSIPTPPRLPDHAPIDTRTTMLVRRIRAAIRSGTTGSIH